MSGGMFCQNADYLQAGVPVAGVRKAGETVVEKTIEAIKSAEAAARARIQQAEMHAQEIRQQAKAAADAACHAQCAQVREEADAALRAAQAAAKAQLEAARREDEVQMQQLQQDTLQKQAAIVETILAQIASATDC